MNREVELCEQGGGAVLTGRWSCVNREVELCEHGCVLSCVRGKWSCVNREVVLCEHGSGDV